MYWEIDPGTVRLHSQSNGKVGASLLVQIQALGVRGAPVEESFLVPVAPMRVGNSLVMDISFQRSYALPPGRYLLQSVVSQPDDSLAQPLVFADSLIVPGPLEDFLMVQPLEFEPDSQTLLYPRMLLFVDSSQSTLPLAIQWSTMNVPDSAWPLQARMGLGKVQNQRLLPHLTDTLLLAAGRKHGLITGSLRVGNAESGNYRLYAGIYTAQGAPVVAAATVDIQVYHPGVQYKPDPVSATDSISAAVNVRDLSKSFAVKYTPAQLRAILKMLLPIADDNTDNIIRGLLKAGNTANIVHFIQSFFEDLDPAKPEKAWEAYANEVREVNRLFRESGVGPGYESDRGIIYLKYGKPTYRYRVPNESGAKPYEVWRYNYIGEINRPIVFLFIQEGSALGDYKLVHSTHPQEVQNNQWGTLLFGNNRDRLERSRAWQYMNNQ